MRTKAEIRLIRDNEEVIGCAETDSDLSNHMVGELWSIVSEAYANWEKYKRPRRDIEAELQEARRLAEVAGSEECDRRLAVAHEEIREARLLADRWRTYHLKGGEQPGHVLPWEVER
jgi:hypothetical protein